MTDDISVPHLMMATNLVSLVNKLLEERREIDLWKGDIYRDWGYFDKGPKSYEISPVAYAGKKVYGSLKIAGIELGKLAASYTPKPIKLWEGDLDYLDWDYWFGDSDEDD